MTVSKIPSHYIHREDAQKHVGKSPKTIYRVIKKAVETGDDKLSVLLDHCRLELRDGEILSGRNIASMSQVDDYRRQGRIPRWHLDPDEFRKHFATSEPEANDKETATDDGLERKTSGAVVDALVIEQFEQRLAEKDERIQGLLKDKDELRVQLTAVTELTNKITGLLGHSQLKALGLPGEVPSNGPRDGGVIDVNPPSPAARSAADHSAEDRGVARPSTRPPATKKPKSARKKSKPKKRKPTEPEWYEMPTFRDWISRLR